MNLDVYFKMPPKALAALETFTDDEIKDCLLEIEREALSGPNSVLMKHFAAIQGVPVTEEWRKRKGRKYGKTRNFEMTGRALTALRSASSSARGRRINAKKRRISIWLKGPKTKGGRNVYDIVQNGRFQGLRNTVTGARTSRAKAIENVRRTSSQYKVAKAHGYKGKYSEYVASQRKGPKQREERVSGNAMPLMNASPKDADAIASAVGRAVDNMLRKHGLL